MKAFTGSVLHEKLHYLGILQQSIIIFLFCSFNYPSAIIIAANMLSTEARYTMCYNIQTAHAAKFTRRSHAVARFPAGLRGSLVNGRCARERERAPSLAPIGGPHDDAGAEPIVCQVQRRVTVGNRRAELRPERN